MYMQDSNGNKIEICLSSAGNIVSDMNATGSKDVPNAKTVKEYVDSKLIKENLFNGIGTKPSAINVDAVINLEKNPLDYDIVYVTVRNGGSTLEKTTLTFLKGITSQTWGIRATSAYSGYGRVQIGEKSVTLRATDLTGWSANALYIEDVTGIKFGSSEVVE